MSTGTLPLNLFKANLELQLRVAQLLQESGQRWLEAASRSGSESLAESGAEIESFLKPQDWQALSALPNQVFWRQFQQRIEDTQAASEFALGIQTAFTEGVQQAVQDWQKTVTEVFGEAGTVPQPFQDLLKQWGAAWTAPPRKEKAAAAKGSASRGG